MGLSVAQEQLCDGGLFRFSACFITSSSTGLEAPCEVNLTRPRAAQLVVDSAVSCGSKRILDGMAVHEIHRHAPMLAGAAALVAFSSAHRSFLVDEGLATVSLLLDEKARERLRPNWQSAQLQDSGKDERYVTGPHGSGVPGPGSMKQ
jgi:hypothetical protein